MRLGPALLAASLGLLLLAGCFREATDASTAAVRPRHAGSEPWTIDGVRPGQSFDEVKQLFGEPREIRGTAPGPRTASWERRNTMVTFDRDNRVTEVMGSTIQAGGKVIVQGGAGEAEVTQILGSPGRVQKVSQPKGHVISLGHKHIGTIMIYDNAGVRFELPVFGQAAGHYLARRIPDRP
jgi:hypothetical protein